MDNAITWFILIAVIQGIATWMERKKKKRLAAKRAAEVETAKTAPAAEVWPPVTTEEPRKDLAAEPAGETPQSLQDLLQFLASGSDGLDTATHRADPRNDLPSHEVEEEEIPPVVVKESLPEWQDEEYQNPWAEDKKNRDKLLEVPKTVTHRKTRLQLNRRSLRQAILTREILGPCKALQNRV